jgi:hypothetical protein
LVGLREGSNYDSRIIVRELEWFRVCECGLVGGFSHDVHEFREQRVKRMNKVEGCRGEAWVGVISEYGRRDFELNLQITLMSDNEAAPVVNKNKRHRKEKRMSVSTIGEDAGN